MEHFINVLLKIKRYEQLTREARKIVSKCPSVNSKVNQLILKQKLYKHLSFILIGNFHIKKVI